MRTRMWRWMLCLGIVAVLCSGSVAVNAKTDEMSLNEGTSMTMTPTKAQLMLVPGQQTKDTFKIYNTGTDDFTFYVEVKPYYVKDEGYQPFFDESIESSRTQMSGWISFEQTSFFLASGESVEVDYTISVPLDIPTEGQYAAILAYAEPSADLQAEGSMVMTVKQLGYLIYAQVEGGETREETALTMHQIPLINFKGPLGDIARIENTGNVESAIKHHVKITNFFNGELVYDTDEVDYFVLPDTSRVFMPGWSGSPMLGLFRVESKVWVDGEMYELRGLSLIVPPFLVAIVILMVVLLTINIIAQGKRRKRDFVKTVKIKEN